MKEKPVRHERLGSKRFQKLLDDTNRINLMIADVAKEFAKAGWHRLTIEVNVKKAKTRVLVDTISVKRTKI